MASEREYHPHPATVPPLNASEIPLQMSEEESTFLKAAITQDEDDLRKRIMDVQKKAYDQYPYPCIRYFYYVHLSMSKSPVYDEILEAGRSGKTTFLDLGCCMGTDVRKLAFDGYPATNIIAFDLRQEFIDLGFKLYHDRETSKIRFFPGDIFTVSPGTVDVKPVEFSKATKLTQLKSRVNHFYLGALFHLYDEETQYAIALAVATLLKHEKGSIVFGWHQGQEREGMLDDEKFQYLKHRYGHSPASWAKMWKRAFTQVASAEFAETRVAVGAELEDVSGSNDPVLDPKGKQKEVETPADTLAEKLAEDEQIPFLSRPLGVKERPSTVGMTWREEMMDQDVRMKHRKTLVKEATKGYFSDLNATRRQGGKMWVAPRVLIREDKANYFPDISGTDLNSKKAHTTELLNGKVSAVCVMSSKISEIQTQMFIEPTHKAHHEHPLYQTVRINLQENLLRSFLVSLFTRSIRSTVAKEEWGQYLVSSQNMDYVREDMGLMNKYIAYVFLVDQNCKIRWAGCADPKPEEIEALEVNLGNRMYKSNSPSRSSLGSMSTQYESLPTLEEINKRFTDAQDAQGEIFERSRRQQRTAFLGTIITHEEGGNKRNREFTEFIKAISTTYMTNRATRSSTFDASEEKRDALFEIQERTRQGAFDKAQDLMQQTAQQAREQRLQVSAQITRQRQNLFSTGRARRQQIHDDVAALFSLFDDLMEMQEATFMEVQEQRDAQVDALVKTRGKDYTALNLRVYASRHLTTTAYLTQPKQCDLPTLSPMTISAVPSLGRPPEYPYSRPPPLPVTTQAAPLLPPYSPAETRSGSSVSERQPSASAKVSLDGLTRDYASRYDEVFDEQESRRAEIFAADMAAYQAGFQEVVSNAEAILASRQTVFAQMSKIFRAIYEDDQERQSKFFRQKIFLQNSKEEHRQSQFAVLQQSLVVCFDEDRTSILDHFSIMDQGEWEHIAMLDRSTQDLFLMFRDLLQAQVAKHDAIFADAITEYQRRFGTQTRHAEEHVVIGMEPHDSPLSMPPFMRPDVSYTRETARNTMEGRPLKVEPDVLFTPRALVRPIADMFRSSLPVVDTKLASSDTFRSALLRMLEDHQAKFVQAQTRRQKEFDSSLQKRKELMAMQELEDDRAFYRTTKQWQEAADAWELEYTSHFNNWEKERNNDFLEAEKGRDLKFLRYTSEHRRSFTEFMSTLTTTYFSLVDGLQKKTYETEGVRMKHMLLWGRLKKEETKRSVETWKKKYVDAEAERSRRFDGLLQSIKGQADIM
ncbi:Mitochondrial ATPase complex subunit atp10 [Steccherinum ochraceum]|uniref:Mitochondrial ATPase complex subunit atp10 n=1 Tax=Steccherinum ochraceum TaxID=92696 RepID=A0A4R0RMQ6_9APHY|nr:Mitochondrial ATPase complex subunit atp10 [Steccherinum ochraceum]